MALPHFEFDRDELETALSAALQVIAAQGDMPREYHEQQFLAAFQRGLDRGDVDRQGTLTKLGLARTTELLKARRN